LAFPKLQTRISSLPEVLVGPILRLALPGQVSVFFATKSSRKITLEVFTSDVATPANRVMVGTRSTTKLADRFHVVCVTAKTQAGAQPLSAGMTYCYDIKIGAPGGGDTVEVSGNQRLFSDGIVRANGNDAKQLLTYPTGPKLPSFVMPPANVSDLRLIHASCRKAHGPGPDELPTGDAIIADSFIGPHDRPHQMFLTGDQIYADDVSMALLFMLQDAADALSFQPDQLPLATGLKTGSDSSLLPGSRAPVVRDQAHFTSDACTSHLMTFADYALMYAFAWSDVLWPPRASFPKWADVLPEEARDAEQAAALGIQRKDHEGQMADEDIRIGQFHSGLSAVRRLLANVPTLTIFDDHEITDDWNLNLKWMKDVYGLGTANQATLGTAIVRNGLAAYAVFQAWGNTPEQFDSADANAPGTKLLAALAAWNGTASSAEIPKIQTAVGIPTGATDFTTNPVPGQLVWHYAYRWTQHEVIVLDTRTKRGTVLKENADGPPALIYEESDVDAMTRHDARGEELSPPGPDLLVIVIAPGPVFGVDLHEKVAGFGTRGGKSSIKYLDPEHWALTPWARDYLLGALMTRPQKGTDGVTRSRIVLLGGDVHHGSCVRVEYSAEAPFHYVGMVRYAGRVRGIIAQLTASSLKNQSAGFPAMTLLIEKHGFAAVQYDAEMVNGVAMPVQQISGWANPGKHQMRVGEKHWIERYGVIGLAQLMIPRTNPIFVKGSPAVHTDVAPVLFTYPPAPFPPMRKTWTTPPEWQYEVRPWLGLLKKRSTPAAVAPSGATRTAKIEKMVDAANRHRDYSYDEGVGQKVVGHNNIGVVSFIWNAGDDKTVVHDLWWRDDPDNPDDPTVISAPRTRWEIPLPNGST
jgi:hypothetical protein